MRVCYACSGRVVCFVATGLMRVLRVSTHPDMMSAITGNRETRRQGINVVSGGRAITAKSP